MAEPVESIIATTDACAVLPKEVWAAGPWLQDRTPCVVPHPFGGLPREMRQTSFLCPKDGLSCLECPGCDSACPSWPAVYPYAVTASPGFPRGRIPWYRNASPVSSLRCAQPPTGT